VSTEAPRDQTSDVTASREPAAQSQAEFAALPVARDEYTDDRKLWEWASRYAPEARRGINIEACTLAIILVVVLLLTGLFLALAGSPLRIPLRWISTPNDPASPTGQIALQIEFRLLAIFFAGWVGGATFSIKWLVHAVATGRWHLDRRYWRLLVPGLGGVYACVVLTLFDAGLIGTSQSTAEPRPIAVAAALAFLVGYFSDGVSGLLSNIANAVFGTLEKK
jgi:hypothetical protein